MNPTMANNTRKQLRCAMQLQRQLCRPVPPHSAQVDQAMRLLLGQQSELERCWRMLGIAEHRGWSCSADRLWQEVQTQTLRVQDAAAAITRDACRNRAQEPLPASGRFLFNLMAELRQLNEEFDTVQFDLKQKVIAITTAPVVLEGIALGAFRIVLHIDHLRSRADASAFACAALSPNCASSDESVTHPHVRDDGLCAGEATVPIALALGQGRICDAFCLVHSVLQNYNPSSPYVAMEDWEGVRCDDCESLCSDDDLYSCEHCGTYVCTDCSGCCDGCQKSCCRGCLERDSVSDEDCCPDCRCTCCDCDRVVESSRTVDDRCPQCHAEHMRDAEDQTELQPQENDHEPMATPAS